MLSVKYHIVFWAISSLAAATYSIVIRYAPIFEDVFQALVPPLATYALFTMTKEPSQADLYRHQARIACLLISLGSFTEFFHVFGDDTEVETRSGWLVHILLAFMVCGTLEAIRQDNREIEPASLYLILRGPRTKLSGYRWPCCMGYWAALAVYNAILVCILAISDWILVRACGVGIRGLLPFWNGNIIDAREHCGSAVVCFYLGGPFADMAETVFYTLCRGLVPGWERWEPRLGSLVKRGELWPLFDTEIVMSSLLWIPYVAMVYFLE